MSLLDHWQTAWTDRDPEGVSWYAEHLDVSLELIAQAELPAGARIIDVGGGASTLPRDLLTEGYNVTVLDLAEAALETSRARLGARAAEVSWLTGNVVATTLPTGFHLWHDRAVFHFLTDPYEQAAYVAQLTHALRPGGQVVISTFAHDGPKRCSGLATKRYTPERLLKKLGSAFEGLDKRSFVHTKPNGETQNFVAVRARRR
jgi:2-polyprenyl-3-methyl-5-hydroxy-6-metoxy-1,4-benzoquinol methylase